MIFLQTITPELSKLSEFGLLGTMLALTITVIVYLFRDSMKEKKNIYKERNVKEEKQNELEKEFREHLISNETKLIAIIQQNSEALNRNAKAYEKFGNLFEQHTNSKINL